MAFVHTLGDRQLIPWSSNQAQSFFEEAERRQNERNNTSSGFLLFESGLKMLDGMERNKVKACLRISMQFHEVLSAKLCRMQ